MLVFYEVHKSDHSDRGPADCSQASTASATDQKCRISIGRISNADGPRMVLTGTGCTSPEDDHVVARSLEGGVRIDFGGGVVWLALDWLKLS